MGQTWVQSCPRGHEHVQGGCAARGSPKLGGSTGERDGRLGDGSRECERQRLPTTDTTVLARRVRPQQGFRKRNKGLVWGTPWPDFGCCFFSFLKEAQLFRPTDQVPRLGMAFTASILRPPTASLTFHTPFPLLRSSQTNLLLVHARGHFLPNGLTCVQAAPSPLNALSPDLVSKSYQSLRPQTKRTPSRMLCPLPQLEVLAPLPHTT